MCASGPPVFACDTEMGAARRVFTSYGDRWFQTTYFRVDDTDWLDANLNAQAASSATCRCLWPDTPLKARRCTSTWTWTSCATFVELPLPRGITRPRLDAAVGLPRSRKRTCVAPALECQVMSHPNDANGTVTLGDRSFNMIVRSRLQKSTPDEADIKNLRSKDHLVADTDLTAGEARRLSYSELRARRNADYPDTGLLLLYPIQGESKPGLEGDGPGGRIDLGADRPVIGVVLAFPAPKGANGVDSEYIAVDPRRAKGALPMADVDWTTELRRGWATLDTPMGDGISTMAVADTATDAVRIAIDGSGRRHLLVPISEDDRPTLLKRDGPLTMEMTKLAFSGPTVEFVDVACDGVEFFEPFTDLCSALLEVVTDTDQPPFKRRRWSRSGATFSGLTMQGGCGGKRIGLLVSSRSAPW